jgi:chromosome segregation ATPase
MDERKKQIEALERSNRESRGSLDSLLARFGESLFSRIPDTPVESGDVTEYRQLQKDIADSNSAIFAVEEQIRRQRELEEEIELKEHENKERAKELSGMYIRLGKVLLEDKPDIYADFDAPFRDQAGALNAKIESLHSRIAGLDQKEGSNVFTWIGKSAQSLVLRSFLTKAQESLEQLYRSAGESFSRGKEAGMSGENAENEDQADTAALSTEIENACAGLKDLSEELKKLQDEKRLITADFDVQGNPLKQIQSLKNHIGHAREELGILYRRFGGQAVSADAPEFINALIVPEDREVLDNAARLSRAIQDNETAIGKLRTALAIDEEKAKIEKCRNSIEDKKKRIADAQKAIADLQGSITDCEKQIEELQKLL